VASPRRPENLIHSPHLLRCSSGPRNAGFFLRGSGSGSILLEHRLTTKEFAVLLSIADVLALIPVSRGTLYNRMAEPDFPRPVKIGGRVFWKQEELYAYIESKQDKIREA
jgi:predicted DNA-binding transcriptional regulator AlpA